jgi:hypothetical protein
VAEWAWYVTCFNTYCIEILVFIGSLSYRKASILENLLPQYVGNIWHVFGRFEANYVKVVILKLFTVSWHDDIKFCKNGKQHKGN